MSLLGAGASPAFAVEDPPGGQVDHSGELYTLDGKMVPREQAESGQTCVGSPDADGVVACFSTMGGLARASAARLRAGELPLGYGALPPGVSRAELISRLDRMAARDSQLSPGTAARLLDGYSCRTDPYTYIWNDAGYVGTSGTMGYTGNTYWRNYSSTYDNKVSSFWAMDGATTRWHDYANGGGAYYGNGYACRYVDNLGNANMTDGGTANDRFSSWIIY